MSKMHISDSDRQGVFDLTAQMLEAGGVTMNQVRVQVNKEYPDMDWGTKKWTILEAERKRSG